MQRRIAIDCALSSMTPKAVPDAPLGALARQWYADADVDTAAVIVAPTNIATRKRLIIDLPYYKREISLVIATEMRRNLQMRAVSARDATSGLT